MFYPAQQDRQRTSFLSKKQIVIAVSCVVVAAIVVGGIIGGFYLFSETTKDIVKVCYYLSNKSLKKIRNKQLHLLNLFKRQDLTQLQLQNVSSGNSYFSSFRPICSACMEWLFTYRRHRSHSND